jgi:hypothetical protein
MKWKYKKNKDGFMGSENRIIVKDAVSHSKKKDKPQAGKLYALTGGPGSKCIANGNTWEESVIGKEVKI